MTPKEKYKYNISGAAPLKMAAHYLVNIVVLLFSIINCRTDEVNPYNDSLREELFLKPFSSGHIYSYFQFTTIWNTNNQVNPCKYLTLIDSTLTRFAGFNSVAFYETQL